MEKNKVEKRKKRSIKKLLENKMLQDGILSIGAKCIFFLVLKGLIEPWMNRTLGDAAFGDYVVYYGYICIFSYSCGEALNHIRVLNQETDRERAKDYRWIITVEALISILILFCFGRIVEQMGVGEGILFGVTSAALMLRLYSECVFRIEINYKKILFSSVLMSVGYLAGYLIFQITGQWYVIFLLGEIIAVLYAALSGKLFWVEKKKGVSQYFVQTAKNAATLTGSYLISYALIYMDRFLVQYLLGSEQVSTYYIATTYGKCVALVIPPITAVLLSNISKGTITLDKKMVNKVVAGSLGAILLFFLVGLPMSRIILFILYPASYENCLSVMDTGNLAQIVYYSCSIVNMMAIRLCDMKLQVFVETAYAILYILFAVVGAAVGGLVGLAVGTLGANILRFILLTVPVYRKVR